MDTECPGEPGLNMWGADTWVAGTAAGHWSAWDPEEPHSGALPPGAHRVLKRHNIGGLSVLLSLLGAASEVGCNSLHGWQTSNSLHGTEWCSGGGWQFGS